MPIIHYSDAPSDNRYPGVNRATLVDASQGALSIYIGHLQVTPGSSIATHIHPDTEEAMIIVEGALEAILGDEVVTLGPGDTVLAPAGVKHGFVNRTGENARLIAAFPKTSFERVTVD